MVAAGGSRIQIEATDPLFLHPLDQPGQSLVADVFHGDDYKNWKRSVTIALLAKQKTSFIDGSSTRPDTGSPLYPYWQRCNDMVI